MRKDFINVVPNKQKGCWSIHKGLCKNPSKSCGTKHQAEQWARNLCRKTGLPLALYNLNGQLSARNSFVKAATPQKTLSKASKKAAPQKTLSKTSKKAAPRRRTRR